MSYIKQSITEYTKKRTWWFYVPLTLWFAYILYHHALDPMYQNRILGTFNLIIHEAGHYAVFAFFSDLISIMGGTLLETLFPIIFLFAFLKQGDYFGISFCLGWLATSLFGTATYVGDAQEMLLPLLGGDATIHDWNYILTHLGILHLDDTFSFIIRLSAFVCMSIALGMQISLIAKMYQHRKSGHAS